MEDTRTPVDLGLSIAVVAVALGLPSDRPYRLHLP